jgi:hypothetical protein
MNAPSLDVADMLVAESALGLEYGKNLFITKEPASPINCVTILDTGGYPPQLVMDGERYEYPTINIRVRASHFSDAWDLIDRIVVTLHGRNHETWNGTLYTVIRCANNPALLDQDENGKTRVVVNVNLQRR